MTGPATAQDDRQHALQQLTQDCAYADAVVAIDDLMVWCRTFLAPVIALGQTAHYAETAAFDIVAPRILTELDAFDAALAGLPDVTARLRAAAADALGEGGAT